MPEKSQYCDDDEQCQHNWLTANSSNRARIKQNYCKSDLIVQAYFKSFSLSKNIERNAFCSFLAQLQYCSARRGWVRKSVMSVCIADPYGCVYMCVSTRTCMCTSRLLLHEQTWLALCTHNVSLCMYTFHYLAIWVPVQVCVWLLLCFNYNATQCQLRAMEQICIHISLVNTK